MRRKKYFFNDNSKFEEIGLVGFDVKYIVNRYRLQFFYNKIQFHQKKRYFGYL